MGFNASWLAVRGKSPASVLAALQLERTGEYEETPESPITGISLPNGWFLIFANDFGFTDRAPLATLSESAEVVTCAVEEHVMASSASGLADGRLDWSITHDAQQGISHLNANGRLPPYFQDVFTRLRAEQQNAGGDRSHVDYIFDVPVELAQTLTGFRHDRWLDGARFERLK